GAIIAEQFESRIDDAMLERFGNASEFAAQALGNAVRSRGRIFTRAARALEGLLTLPRLSKLTIVLLLLAAAGFALAVIPAQFEVTVRGQLQPAIRRDVFAPRQGVVKQLFVADDLNVEQHAKLMLLEDPDLEFQIEQFDGELRTTTQSLAATRARLGTSTTPGTIEHDQLAADVSELEERVKNLMKLIAALKQQRDQLAVVSPITGRVLTADFRELLSDRPVLPGQVLLKVADVTGPWALELNVPDQDVGHVLRAKSAANSPLSVTFLLATNPSETYAEVLGEIGETTELFDGETPSVRVIVPVVNSRRDSSQPRLTDLRPGATVIAKIQCGERPLGVVWFHEIIEFVQSRVLF
ncbi:MAG: efflux RND transporter periplasmic adaptor subunit, partial [Planctomycetota bacterium]|nr:efflux RND transporter periplasmic adaptor subunit [Planctomycetota bacterium]